MNEQATFLETLGQLFIYLPGLMVPVIATGVGLSKPGVRGKIWLALWGAFVFFSTAWWAVRNFIFFRGGSITQDTPIYEKLEQFDAFNPIFMSLLPAGIACILLFITSQSSLSPDYVKVLFSPQGRISRQPCWIGMIATQVISYAGFAAFFLTMAEISRRKVGIDYSVDLLRPKQNEFAIATVVMWFWALIAIWPSIAVQIKRWHDRDKSGWMVLINLIPLIGPIWTLVELGMLRGSRGINNFGDDPLASNAPHATMHQHDRLTRHPPDP